jgi:serine/threonine protein kinase
VWLTNKQLLHNELVPDVPHVLKVKMVYQAAKGMHFLHSSGIVHRDLKSLNLLLDAKWNVKVSDFGLTKFKAVRSLLPPSRTLCRRLSHTSRFPKRRR